jgi:hypothetical protein
MNPTAEFLVERIVSLGLARPKEIIGCSEEEIRALEVIHQVRLPRAYRDFLAVMGHGAGQVFHSGEGWGFNFNCVRYLNWQVDFAHSLLAPGVPFPMPKTAFFIGTFQSMDYWFLDLADGADDPPVWGFGDSWAPDDTAPRECRRVASGIWELVEIEIECRVQTRDNLARMYRGLFDGEPGAAEAKSADELRLRGLRELWEALQHRLQTERANRGPDDEIPF